MRSSGCGFSSGYGFSMKPAHDDRHQARGHHAGPHCSATIVRKVASGRVIPSHHARSRPRGDVNGLLATRRRRVLAAGCETGTGMPLTIIAFAPFQLDLRAGQLSRDGVPVPLRPKTFAVLQHLAQGPGELVTKQALLDAVWGDVAVSEDVVRLSAEL